MQMADTLTCRPGSCVPIKLRDACRAGDVDDGNQISTITHDESVLTASSSYARFIIETPDGTGLPESQ